MHSSGTNSTKTITSWEFRCAQDIATTCTVARVRDIKLQVPPAGKKLNGHSIELWIFASSPSPAEVSSRYPSDTHRAPPPLTAASNRNEKRRLNH
ncbi:hypothetical protein DOTSEDRAFT_67430 [Dothistroma septosporum NZE10]|uniref:Uncharacterized protein n=1 Tax=Dothistroma septosporum (strain NZE10 / CBS 128990) TaxID=675120 RepID=N1Q1I1_DOTSN|nr:hypothetical protein DOTSEDRAFT_67430 [Dothistroma septosporum NZE10]